MTEIIFLLSITCSDIRNLPPPQGIIRHVVALIAQNSKLNLHSWLYESL